MSRYSFVEDNSLTKERQRRVRELFDAVHDMDSLAQQRFLLNACEGDAELAGAVWKLLLVRHREAGFLDTPVVNRQETESVKTAEPGIRIGSYKILRKLGGGGMGTVYQALRDDDVFQRVSALKVIHPAVASGRLVQKFYEERQILARLDHPNISRIVDGGTTSDGRPYFVMDFVDGLSLRDYCRANYLGLRERLELFRQVCSATQYLHDNDVIHCDLKPANILVGRDKVVKLVDFGIARLIGEGVQRPGLPLMTPGYASPEQLSGMPVTPASDVYALGVTLYEVLTGCKPFIRETTQELVTAVTTIDPIPPSEAATSQSEERALVPSSKLKGDLDCIILKALRRDTNVRYHSAKALDADVERYLQLRPVSANPRVFPYRIAKFLRRNASITVVVLLILALAGVDTWQGVLLQKRYEASGNCQANFAATQNKLIESGVSANNLQALAEAYRTNFSEAIRIWPGMTPERQELVNEGEKYLTDSQQKLARDPDALKQLALTWLELGDVEGNPQVPNLGNREASRQSINRAIEIVQSLGASRDQLKLLKAIESDLQAVSKSGR